MKTAPFLAEAALNGWPCITRNGRDGLSVSMREFYTGRYPYLVKRADEVWTIDKDGCHQSSGSQSHFDVFLIIEDDDGYKYWPGGLACPVVQGRYVDIKLRNGEVRFCQRAGSLYWTHSAGSDDEHYPAYDVLWYKLHNQDEAKAPQEAKISSPDLVGATLFAEALVRERAKQDIPAPIVAEAIKGKSFSEIFDDVADALFGKPTWGVLAAGESGLKPGEVAAVLSPPDDYPQPPSNCRCKVVAIDNVADYKGEEATPGTAEDAKAAVLIGRGKVLTKPKRRVKYWGVRFNANGKELVKRYYKSKAARRDDMNWINFHDNVTFFRVYHKD